MWLDDLLEQLKPQAPLPIPHISAVAHPRHGDAAPPVTATSDGPLTTAGMDAPATPAGLAVLAAQAATARPIILPAPPRHADREIAEDDAITYAPLAPQAQVAGLPARYLADDRIACTACAHFSPPGCLACRRGLFSFRSRDHYSDPERLHRCFFFRPLHQDPDQRHGDERWPELAWQRRARR